MKVGAVKGGSMKGGSVKGGVITDPQSVNKGAVRIVLECILGLVTLLAIVLTILNSGQDLENMLNLPHQSWL